MFPFFVKFLGWDPAEPSGGDVVWYFARQRRGALFRVRVPLSGNGSFEMTEVVNLDRTRFEQILFKDHFLGVYALMKKILFSESILLKKIFFTETSFQLQTDTCVFYRKNFRQPPNIF